MSATTEFLDSSSFYIHNLQVGSGKQYSLPRQKLDIEACLVSCAWLKVLTCAKFRGEIFTNAQCALVNEESFMNTCMVL